MPLQVVIIGPEEKEQIARVVRHAQQPEHWYRPWLPRPDVPGENLKHLCRLGTYRCVFSYTVSAQRGRVYRHLSISVPQKDRVPTPVSIKYIARYFGFTGYDSDEAALSAPMDRFPDDWDLHVETKRAGEHPYVMVMQDAGIDIPASDG